jgi:hypothetical protein
MEDRTMIARAMDIGAAHEEALREDAERDRRRWHSFCALWSPDKVMGGIGLPFFKCTYCEAHHWRPDVVGAPCCKEAGFVQGVIAWFPMLRRSPHLQPWKPLKFARYWRTSGAQTSGSYHAVAFVLSVWSGSSKEWKARGYSFDVSRAFQCWDDQHRDAFRRWAANPWWP